MNLIVLEALYLGKSGQGMGLTMYPTSAKVGNKWNYTFSLHISLHAM